MDSATHTHGVRLACVGLEAYIFRYQTELKQRIAFAWQKASAPRTVFAGRKSAWQCIIDEASQGVCVCSGSWVPMTEELLRLHRACATAGEQPNSLDLRKAIC